MAEDLPFSRLLERHRTRAFARVAHRVPSSPRCAICGAPYAGIGGRILRPFGFSPSRKNPRLCARCFELAPIGGEELEAGILFADIRGFTTLAEGRAPDHVAAHLNRFYAMAVEILCRRAIVDKLVGDQVMALYLPGLFAGEPADHMVADADALLAAAASWVDIGIGLDLGPAFVGNVGAGDVKDFTAVGDVVNTASRLQSAAASGEIVMSLRVHARTTTRVPAAPRELTLRGRAEPERALVRTLDR